MRIRYALLPFFAIFATDHTPNTMKDTHFGNEERPPRYVSEWEYAEDLRKKLNELAEGIARSGMSYSAIARGCRVGWWVVRNASKGIPVRFDSAARIGYFLGVIEGGGEA